MPNKYRRAPVRLIIEVIGPSIAYVELTRGQFALIDHEDAHWIGRHNWHARWSQGMRSFYATRGLPYLGNEKRRWLQMHAAILWLEKGIVGDHQNRNTLDNRRSNLRETTQSKNCQNSKVRRDNSAGYKGVDFNKYAGKYRARISINGRLKHLGWFDEAAKAGEAYVMAARLHHGEFFCDQVQLNANHAQLPSHALPTVSV
jgi:hypothetical protein